MDPVHTDRALELPDTGLESPEWEVMAPESLGSLEVTFFYLHCLWPTWPS